MPRCTNCDYEWKAKEVLALGFSKRGKDCPKCGQKQYISAETQRMVRLSKLISRPISSFSYQIER